MNCLHLISEAQEASGVAFHIDASKAKKKNSTDGETEVEVEDRYGYVAETTPSTSD